MKEIFSLHNKKTNYNIPVITTIPDGNKVYPVLVMCHGTGSDKNEVGNMFEDLAEKLVSVGIGSVRFDFAGTGDSEVDYIEYSLTSAVSDVEVMVEYIKSNPNLDNNKMAVLGFSQGGAIALLAEARLRCFKALVSWSGAPVLKNGLISLEMEEEALKNGFVMLELGFTKSLRLSKKWVEDINSINVLEEFGKVSIPILGIAGINDAVVPCKYTSEIVSLSDNKSTQEVLLETDHIFNVLDNDKFSSEAINKTKGWLKEVI